MKKLLFSLFILLMVQTAHAFDMSHRLWTQTLREHNKDSWINYGTLKSRPDSLNAYLKSLGSLSISIIINMAGR